MDTMKLSTVQKRAKTYCDNIKRWGGKTSFVVEWKRSAMWGSNPVIDDGRGKMCSVSGCGYCKLSTALADVLCFLFEPESVEFNDVARTGGAGVNSVISALDKHGYELRQVTSTKTADVFELSNRGES